MNRISTFEAIHHEANWGRDPIAWLVLKDYLEEEGKPMILDIGKKYLVLTVTHYYTGECVESTPGRTVLKDGAWIPDTGRLTDAIESGEFQEVEPLPKGESLVINTSAIVAAYVWDKPLPRKRK